MDYIMLPSKLPGFINTETTIGKTRAGREAYILKGELASSKEPHFCPHCKSKMHINQSRDTELKHLPYGSTLCVLAFKRHQYICPSCGHTEVPEIPFKAKGHRVTLPMLNFAHGLLEMGLTNSEVCYLTGLSKNTVKDIDMERLQGIYTVLGKDGERHLMKPEHPARFLAIDEFKLHNGYKYATIIVDLENGHALWIAKGKKKAVVYDFIEHVGHEWMDGVEAVACDMNSDFQEAFEERCPHIQPVFDYFHIVKNFNDKVISEVRKDEQRRLIAEGNVEAAQALKNTKYILTSSRETLIKKDAEAAEGKVIERGSELFKSEAVTRKVGYLNKYESLLKENEIIVALDLVKAKLEEAYALKDEAKMAAKISEISDLCLETKNPHFRWFSRLLLGHFEGIIAHATYGISTSKLEGINNKIKTLRRQGYGYPDDDYFFLKLFDVTRRGPLSKR